MKPRDKTEERSEQKDSELRTAFGGLYVCDWSL